MKEADEAQLEEIRQTLNRQHDVLVQRFTKALKATVFSNRPSLLPATLPALAIDEAAGFLNFLEKPDKAVVRAMGEKRAYGGLGDESGLRLGAELRAFCRACLADAPLLAALGLVDTYVSTWLEGFLKGWQRLLLEEQNGVQQALRSTVMQRSQQLRSAAEIGSLLAASYEQEDVLSVAATQIQSRLEFYYVGIFLWDSHSQALILAAESATAPEAARGASYRVQPDAGTIVARCFADRQVISSPFSGEVTGVEVAMPLQGGGDLLGVLLVQTVHLPKIAEEDRITLGIVASQLSTAVQNMRAWQQARLMLRRMESLYEIAQASMLVGDALHLLENVAERAAKVLPANRISVIIFDLKAQRVLNFVRGGIGKDYINTEVQFEELLHGLAGWVLQERKPVLSLKNVLDPRESLEVQQRRMATHCGSIIVVPLLYQDDVLGVITAINLPEERDFIQEDVDLLMAMANSVAAAIQNMRLMARNQQALEQISARASQMETASIVSRAASSILDTQTLLHEVVNLIQERFKLYYVGIFLVDEFREWAVLRAGTGLAGQQMLLAGHRLLVGGDSMIGKCVSEGKARIALDVGAEAVRFNNPHLPHTHSEMALPLIARGEVIGAMTIQSEQTAAFSDADIIVLQTMADQVANAISNARLFAEAQARLEEVQRLQRQMIGETWQAYAQQKQVLGYMYELNEAQPLATPIPVPALPELAQGQTVTRRGDDGGVALLAPLTVRGEPIGLLGFEELEEVRDWSQDDVALIEAVREQLGLALENRLLFAQTTEALAETSNLYDIGQQISTARSADEILRAALDGLMRRPEPDRLVIGLLEPMGKPELLRVIYSWSRSGGQLQPGATFPLEHWGPIYEALNTVGRFVVADSESDPKLSDVMRTVYRQIGVRGVAGFQLGAREVQYGTVLIYTHEPHDFATEELRFYETIIQNTSVALENQYLLENTQAEAARRALLNEVMSAASSSLNPVELIHDVTRLIAERLEMPAMLWRWDDNRALPVAIYRADGVEVIPQEEMTFRMVDMPGIGAVIRTRRPLRWRYDMRPYHSRHFEELLNTLDLEEAFTAPLLVRERTLGVLILGQQRGHPPIDDNEMLFIRGAAVNIGVALENANLYQDVQETAEKLKEVDRLKTEFLANMSHELRTPLNSIIGFSRVILKGIDGPLTDMQQTDLQAIHDSGKHLLSLINDILDQSKIEAGKMEFSFEPTSVPDIITSVLSTSIALVKDKPIELRKDIPEQMPLVVADERRVRQVILNFISNAAKFTEAGYIRVFASYDEQEVVIGVQDTGIGIPKNRYAAVFNPFEQVDSSSTRSYGGTGLGLAVSKSFIEAHGGRIWFESEVGVGSIFYIALPLKGPLQARDEADDTAPGAGRTVLTVDDDEGVITLFRRYLENQGYQVVGLTRGGEVVAEAKRLKPYAITLDIIMPDLDGWHIIRSLKSDPETRDIPIIVCSIVGDKDKGMSMGVSDYLIKPIMEQDLMDALERLSEDGGPTDILVVDDNPDDRKLLRRILEGAGYIVEEAAGGAAAIDHIYINTPDLVILDLMMPEVDGFAVLENLKSTERTRRVPVIVVTAKELTSKERDILRVRAEALLQKGIFNQDQLLNDVTVALERLAFSH